MKDIEKLKNLPSKQPMRGKYKDGRWYSKFASRGGIYRKIDNKYPWTYVDRILKKYKGKNVDVAFSKYCEIVDKCQQFLFWDEVNDYDRHNWKRSGNYAYWYVDDNKCIQRYSPKKKKNRYCIPSYDIKYGYYHIHTGKEVQDYLRFSKNVKYGIVQGQLFEFDKKNEDFHRCYAEQLSKRKKIKRKFKAETRKKEYSFLTQEEKDKNKAREEDKIKLESHGFDDVSFTNKDGRLNNLK